MEKNKPRWQYRFDNYKRAFQLLREAMELVQKEEGISDLEQEGVIQRFEYTWELAWKTLKDYLEHDGIVLEKITPKAVILAGIESKIITDQEGWMKILDDRNKMSHVYDSEEFRVVIKNIHESHLSLLESFYEKLFDEVMQDQS